MRRKKSWIIKGIPVLDLAGIIALNLLIFPKVLAGAGYADEGKAVELPQEELAKGVSRNQEENTKEKGSDASSILDPEMYSEKVEGQKLKAIQKEDGTIWIMVDSDTAKEINEEGKTGNSSLGILVVETEKNTE
ncbi:MAG: hypothetical protein GX094_12265 [Clostridiales bacterium]|nr:hypothetical protein [Clostridiales bacterium]